MSDTERRERERQSIIKALTAWTGEAGGGPDLTDDEIETFLLIWEKKLTEE